MRATFVSMVAGNGSPGAKMMSPVLVAQTVSIVSALDQFSQQLRDVLHVPHIPQVHPGMKKKYMI